MNWAILVIAPIVNMAIGIVWYSMPLFGRMWQKDVGLSDADFKRGPGIGYLVSITSAAIMGGTLSWLAMATGTDGLVNVALLGGAIGLGFITTSFAMNYAFAQKPYRLLAIDAGFQILFLVVVGAIVGAL